MSKRGQLEAVFLILLVIGIVGALSLYYNTKLFEADKTNLKITAVRDIALIIDTIYASPHDLEVEYDIDLRKFIVDISQNKIKIYDASSVSIDSNSKILGKDRFFAQYSFAPVDDSLQFIFDGPKKLTFSKINGKLTITT